MYTGPNISDTGLILSLDAANVKSYVNGSTTWTDLSRRGNNGTLINGPIYDSSNLGGIVCDGVNDYVASSVLSSTSFSNITIQVWIYPTNISGPTTYVTVFDTGGRHLSLWIGGPYYGLGGVSNPYSGNFNFQNNTWCLVTMLKSGPTGQLIKNNYEVSTTFSAGSTFSDQLQFGTNPSTGGVPFAGKYGSIKIYNRALSPEEIVQSYEGLKSRYGL